MTDDYSADTATTGSLTVGGKATGSMDGFYDNDWFRIHLEADTPYIFMLQGAVQGAGTLVDLRSIDYTLLNAKGEFLSGGIDVTGQGEQVIPIVRVPASGDYYLSVGTYLDRFFGSYTITAQRAPSDDIPDAASTSATLTLNQSTKASFEMLGDADWFKFHAEAGQHYIFSTSTPLAKGIFDAQGKAVDYGYPFEPSVSGDYYLAAYGSLLGDYSITLKTVQDDYSGNATTPGQLAENGQVSGSLQFLADRDSFLFSMEAGRFYSFSLDAAGGVEARLLDLQASDSNGKKLDLVLSRDLNGALKISAAPTTSGSYLLTVGSNYPVSLSDGKYVLTSLGSQKDDFGGTNATAGSLEVGGQLSGALQSPTDVDLFKVELQGGVAYAVNLHRQNLETGSSTLLFSAQDSSGNSVTLSARDGQPGNYFLIAPTDGSYFFKVGGNNSTQPAYTLGIALAPDDYTANPATTGAISLEAPAIGKLEAAADIDWFATELTAGSTYWFTLNGDGETPIKLAYSLARIRLLDSQGKVVAETVGGYNNTFPVLAYAPASGGRYYVELFGKNYVSGGYKLVEQLGLRDDYGNDNAHAADLQLDSPASGRMEVNSDRDVFKLSVVAGNTYRVELAAASASPGGSGRIDFMVSDPQQTYFDIRKVDTDGQKQVYLFEALHTGDYYVGLTANLNMGTTPQGYVLKASTYGPDDLASDTRTKTILPVGGRVQGAINYPDDKDWVKVHLESGRSYVFEMQGWKTGGGTLDTGDYGVGIDLYSPDGSKIYLSGGANSVEPRLSYTAASTGDYYLGAHGNNRTLGSYTFKATQTTGDLTAPTLVSGPLDGFSLTGKIVLTFNEAVSVNPGSNFQLSGGGVMQNINGSYSVSVLGNSVILDPYKNLAPGVNYTLQIDPGAVIDLAGNKYAGGAWHFNTVPLASTGTDGNDFLIGLADGQQINGGAGIDTVYYDDAKGGFTVTRSSSNVTIVQPWWGGNGDILTGVERLLFGTEAKALDIDGHGGQVYRLYQAAFNRTPDPAGLGFWMSAMDKGESLSDVAKEFMASAEFSNTYGAKPSDADFVNLLYHNVLHRDAEPAGLAYWLQALHSGTPRESILYSFSESAENQAALIGQIGNGFWYTPFG